MLRIISFLLVFSVLGLSGCGQVEFTLSNGQQKSLVEFNRGWLVINYWAIWCKPCVEEIPELNILNKQNNITVLGVNFDGLVGEELAEQAEKLGIEYDLVVNDLSEDLNVKRPGVLPATLLIDRSGITREILYGPQTAESISKKLSLLE